MRCGSLWGFQARGAPGARLQEARVRVLGGPPGGEHPVEQLKRGADAIAPAQHRKAEIQAAGLRCFQQRLLSLQRLAQQQPVQQDALRGAEPGGRCSAGCRSSMFSDAS